MLPEGLSLREAAKYLNKHVRTLQKWDNSGTLTAFRTKTNRRYWLKSQLDAFLGRTEAQPDKVVAYCRVSSAGQKNDLKSQRECIEQFCLNAGKANVEYICEVGGGLNFKRKEFLRLVDMIVARQLTEVIVAHKDRLARFGFELLQHLCNTHNVTLTIINIEKLSPEQEMVTDLMTIIHCFSSRLCGLRSYKGSIKKHLQCK